MTRLKRFKIGLFTITLGMVLVGASFALADDKAIAEGIILPEELNETTAILTPSVAIAENEPPTQPEEWIDAVATAYCPCEICCGKWALNRPDGIVYTASGAIAEEGVTIAADWSVYSPGTILYIEGIGERTVQDRGGAIRGQKIDVFFNSHEDALRFGRQEVRIKVISDTEPHFVVDNKPYNWEECPIAWLKYNEEELPLCYYIKDLIDDINWQTSVTSDVLRDVAKFIYILRNYGGQDLAEFLKDLKEHMAIKVTSDGGVDKLQADLNIDAVMAFLDKQRRDLFDFAAAVDTKDPDLGNASGTAINFRYMDLDADCDSLGTELKDTFRRLKLFIDVYFQITGQGDFTNEEFDIVFNMDLPVNETDIINNAVNSNGLLSKRTILQNHPWVTDVDEELARIDEEKKAAMEEYGDGLFNHAMGADDSQEGGDSAGLNGGDGNDE